MELKTQYTPLLFIQHSEEKSRLNFYVSSAKKAVP